MLFPLFPLDFNRYPSIIIPSISTTYKFFCIKVLYVPVTSGDFSVILLMTHSSIPINSVNAKLQHAESHLNSIKDEVRAWMDSNPYSISKQTKSDSTRYSLILRINKEPPLQRWSLFVGDIVHNLRCVLDHLVYAIAIHESGQEPPPSGNKLMFPICDTSAKFRGESNRRLVTLSDSIRAAIETVQPYNRPHEKLPPLLAILRDFNNTDKHRLLHLAYSAVSLGNIGFCGPSLSTNTRGQFVANAGELKDGAEIAAFVFESPTPDMKYDRIVFDIVIALRHGKRHLSDPAFNERSEFIGLIHSIKDEVKSVIDITLNSI